MITLVDGPERPSGRVDVFFRVTPDQPATFGPVTIVGLGSLPEGPVRRTLDLQQGERYYQARGFYEARVRAGRVVYLSPTDVRVTVEVEEGSPAVIGKVVVVAVEAVQNAERGAGLKRRDACN